MCILTWPKNDSSKFGSAAEDLARMALPALCELISCMHSILSTPNLDDNPHASFIGISDRRKCYHHQPGIFRSVRRCFNGVLLHLHSSRFVARDCSWRPGSHNSCLARVRSNRPRCSPRNARSPRAYQKPPQGNTPRWGGTGAGSRPERQFPVFGIWVGGDRSPAAGTGGWVGPGTCPNWTSMPKSKLERQLHLRRQIAGMIKGSEHFVIHAATTKAHQQGTTKQLLQEASRVELEEVSPPELRFCEPNSPSVPNSP